jgi:GcrA cell cycle regulator
MDSVSQPPAQDTPAIGWTDDRVEALKELWASGWSSGHIARLLGVTRNAVMGKIHKLGLHKTHRPAGTTEPAAHIPPNSAWLHPKAAPPSLPPEPPSDGKGIQFTELTNVTCRWPKGTPGDEAFCFCGSPTADLSDSRPYCAAHTQLAIRR